MAKPRAEREHREDGEEDAEDGEEHGGRGNGGSIPQRRCADKGARAAAAMF